MVIIDKLIGAFSPKAAFNRARYRYASTAINEQQRKFDAAAKTRRTDGWHATGTSPNNETIAVLRTLRDRSRELVRNNAYAKRAIQAIRNNTIGTGIRPTPTVVKEFDLNKVKDAWWKWAETKQCDWSGKETFYGLQKLVIAAVAQDGEVIIRKRRVSKKNAIIPIKLQVCEVDQIDDSKEQIRTSEDGWIIQGIEFRKDGTLKGYWLFDRHPGDSLSMVSRFVSSDDVLHIYLQERPGQVRGIPWTAAIMMKLRDFDDFEDAQLMQQKIAACFAAFVTKETELDISTDVTYEDSERVEPGIIEHLRPGEDVKFGNPPSTTGQDTFSRKVLQAIAAGLGISYESLTGDLGNVNFSSGRMGWLEMHRNIQEWQSRLMITQFCDPVWDWFLTGLKLAGVVTTDDIVADWTPPRREMIDPVKEITGLAALSTNGFTPWQEIVRMLGFDPDLVIKMFQEDVKRFDAAGLSFASDYRKIMKNSDTKPSENVK